MEHLVDELVGHARHEDLFIHPLLRAREPELARALDDQHRELDLRIETLRSTARAHARVAPSDPNGLYRALAALTAAYLDHLACEEEEALPALWARCSDKELLEVVRAFRASRSDVANLASVAIEKVRMHADLLNREKEAKEVELARAVQLGFLPQTLPVVEGYEFYSHYSPAKTVGGDYYDYIQLPGGRTALVIGDVAGKGVVVVEAGKTTESALKAALGRIESSNVVGLLLNKGEHASLLDGYGEYGYDAT